MLLLRTYRGTGVYKVAFPHHLGGIESSREVKREEGKGKGRREGEGKREKGSEEGRKGRE